MIYDFDAVAERRGTDSLKWNRYGEDVLPLWVADMDFVSPEPVLRALHDRVAHGIFGYPEEVRGLKRALVDRLEGLYGWRVVPDDVVLLPGVVNGFNLAAQALVEKGQGVLIQTPVYGPFLQVAVNAGAMHQSVQLRRHADGHYDADPDAFEAAVTPETRMFLLCNPHNPVGRVFTQGELEAMAEVCLCHGLWVCSDEIHCDLLFPGHSHIPFASLGPEVAARTITLMAPSKTFNVAGLGCSFAVVQDRGLRERFVGAMRGLVGHPTIAGLTAATAAYAEGQEWLSQLLDYLDGNRAAVVQFVQSQLPGVTVFPPEGTYLAWLDCREMGIEANPFDFFLEHARVALSDGGMFGPGGEGFVRLNFGCSRATLLEALERMRAALETFGSR